MEFDIRSDSSTIFATGSLHGPAMRILCSHISKQIDRHVSADVVLDFSQCEWISEATMLPLMPVIAKHRNDDIRFQLVLPQKEDTRHLFLNTNWAHHIDPDKYAPNQHNTGHVPALHFDDFEGHSTILSRIVDLILEQLDTDRNTLKAVDWALWEIIDNVSNHASSPVGGFVQATAFKHQNQVEFVVADGGVGIPVSLQIKDHAQALLEAINEGVTRDKFNNAGNGLYGSYRVATLSGGKFEINSLFGTLYGSSGEIRNRKERVLYNGTSVLCRIALKDKGLLEKALRFDDKPYDPAYDYIESRFETGSGEYVFNMKDQASYSFGSRQGGIQIRNRIQGLLKICSPLVLDFRGVGVISSSFADEVFGRLFVEMGPRSFMKNLEIRNADSTVEVLIDRAIVQRTRLGNGND